MDIYETRKRAKSTRNKGLKKKEARFDDWLDSAGSDTVYDADHHLDSGGTIEPELPQEHRDASRTLSARQAIESALEELALLREMEDFPEFRTAN